MSVSLGGMAIIAPFRNVCQEADLILLIPFQTTRLGWVGPGSRGTEPRAAYIAQAGTSVATGFGLRHIIARI